MAIGCLEVTHIPDYVNPDSKHSKASEHSGNLSKTIRLLISETAKNEIDACAEIFLFSLPVDHQLYPAQPHLLINVYMAYPDRKYVSDQMSHALEFIKNDLINYEYKEINDESVYSQILLNFIDRRYLFSLSIKKRREDLPIQTGALTNVSKLMRELPGTAISLFFGPSEKRPPCEIAFNALVSGLTIDAEKQVAWEFSRHYQDAFHNPCQLPKVQFVDYLDTRTKVFLQYSTPIDLEKFKELLQLPEGNTCGIPIAQPQEELPPFKEGFIGGDGIPMGTVKGTLKPFTVPYQTKTTHISVIGTPGSGKSNFLMNYLKEMWNRFNVPFLVIDPVSNEYRGLHSQLKDNSLNIFTPDSDASPFTFNPFALPIDGISINEYKSILNDFILNSFWWFSPLDKLIPLAVDDVFLKNGWYGSSTTERYPGNIFNIDDFIVSFKAIFKERYKDREDFESAANVRLETLRTFFNSYAPLPLKDICMQPTVLELGSIHYPELKCMMLLYILSMLRVYLRQISDTPILLLVIDEAHSVLEQLGNNEETHHAQMAATRMVNNLLLESRKYGLSVIVADQRFSVLQEIIENTHTQIIFRLEGGNEEVSKIVSLKDSDKLRQLSVGEAYFKDGQIPNPILIKTSRYDGTMLSNDEIKHLMCRNSTGFWATHSYLTKPYPQCSVCSQVLCNTEVRFFSHDIIRMYGADKSDKKAITLLMETKDAIRIQDYLPRGLQDNTPQFCSCIRAQLLHQLRNYHVDGADYIAKRIYESQTKLKLSDLRKENYHLTDELSSLGLEGYDINELTVSVSAKLRKLINGDKDLEFLTKI